MNSLYDRIRSRFEAELDHVRSTLDPDQVVTQAHALHDAPALLRGQNEEWIPALRASENARAATNREAIDLLEALKDRFVRLEASTITAMASLLWESEDTRARVLDRISEHWPWTRADKDHSKPIFMALHQLQLQCKRVERPAITQQEINHALRQWPEGVEPEDVIEFVAQARERDAPGSGKDYRDWCLGVAQVRIFSKTRGAGTVDDPHVFDEEDWALEPSANVLRERTGKPDSITLDVVFDGESSVRLVTGEQLAWLYWSTPETIRMAAAVDRYLASVAAADAQRHLLHTIAPQAITSEKSEAAREASGRLAEQVRLHVELFKELIEPCPAPLTKDAADSRARTLDEHFAAYLETIGSRGQALATTVRKRSQERSPGDEWRLWRREPKGERFLVLLARALWTDKVKPELDAVSSRPALPRAVVADRLIPMMTRQVSLPGLDDGTLRDQKGKVLGRISITTDASLEIVRKGVESADSVAAHKLVRGLVHRAYDQAEPDIRRVSFVGGMQRLLEELSLGRNSGEIVRAIAYAFQCITWETPHVSAHGFWTWSERRGSKAGPGEIVFVLGDALLPGQASVMKGDGVSARMARRLVPELRHEPPMGDSDRSTHGSIWGLHRLWLMELVDCAEDIAQSGFAVVPPARARALAAQARVRKYDAVMHAFLEGDKKNPPLLKRDGDGWTLADQHFLEREFIAQGGRDRLDGRRRRRGWNQRKAARSR